MNKRTPIKSPLKSPYKSPFKSRAEQDQKDILISQLKAENFELKQKERDYNVLNSQLVDLEHRFKVLQEEKYRGEKEARDREALALQKSDNLLTEKRMVNDTLLNREKDIKDINNELTAYRGILDDKNLELEKLKREMLNLGDENSLLSKDNRALEADLQFARESRIGAQSEVDRLLGLNVRLNREKALTEDKDKESSLDAVRLQRKLDEMENDLLLLKKDKEKVEEDVNIAYEGKKSNQREAERLGLVHHDLLEENKILVGKTKDLEFQFVRAQQKLDDGMLLIGEKEREIINVKAGLASLQDQSLEAGAEIRKLRQEHDSLELLLDKYRKDADFQKRLREEEASKKLELEAEKRRLASAAMNREMEVRAARAELEKIQDSQARLFSNKRQLDEELEALRSHTNLLEDQKFKLNKELDHFVETDEKVRKDLDRRYQVDYLKSKNESEYLHSIAKVRNSQSPEKRVPSRSPYKSQGKY